VYGLFTVAALAIAGQDRQGLLPWISGVALAVNVALNVVLIPPLGLDGAAIAMTVSLALMTALAIWLAMRETGAVSPIRMFAAVSAGLAAMAGVALLLGTGGVGLVVSLPAYAVVFLSVEWLLHRDDMGLFARAVRQRGEDLETAPEMGAAISAEREAGYLSAP
jgi:O-antigen/teichoic acid export membrane protein